MFDCALATLLIGNSLQHALSARRGALIFDSQSRFSVLLSPLHLWDPLRMVW
jgi:hypothetical protein